MKIIRYGILLPSGNLARVSKRENNGNCCGAYTYKLTDDSREPEWLVEDPVIMT